jgi:hypothetical protein
MNPEEKRSESVEPKPKAPYKRPKLTRAGTLRDITAQTTAVPPSAPS